MIAVSLTLASYNIWAFQRLIDLEEQQTEPSTGSNHSNNVSTEEAQRLSETFGKEFEGPTSLLSSRKHQPDESQDRIDEETRDEGSIPDGLLPPIDWTTPLTNTNIDIGIPVSGQDQKLLELFRTLGNAIEGFYRQTDRSADDGVTIRAIVTRYSQDDTSSSFRERLAAEAALPKDRVVFATTNEPKFHRAYAINLLHNATKQDNTSVLAIVDVDMDVGPRFLFNSLAEVAKSRFYFPIVFSQYRPSNTMLVEQFLGPQHKYSKHRGLWRIFGYGMYAVSGADVSLHKMNESFTGEFVWKLAWMAELEQVVLVLYCIVLTLLLPRTT